MQPLLYEVQHFNKYWSLVALLRVPSCSLTKNILPVIQQIFVEYKLYARYWVWEYDGEPNRTTAHGAYHEGLSRKWDSIHTLEGFLSRLTTTFCQFSFTWNSGLFFQSSQIPVFIIQCYILWGRKAEEVQIIQFVVKMLH